MIIPFGTDRPLRKPTVVTYWLIGINVAVHLTLAIAARGSPDALEEWHNRLALDANNLTWWTFLSYQFVHGDLLHLLGNMLFLFVFGGNIEDKLGRWWFLAFYLAGGVAAGAAHCAFEPPVFEQDGVRFFVGAVGASGSIAAVTGAYIVYFPRTMIRVLCLIFFIGTFHIPAWWLILGAIAKDLLMQSWAGGQGIARIAHLGGYVFGIAVAMATLGFRLLPREDFDLFTMLRQAKRRREFKELTAAGSSPWRADTATRSARSNPIDDAQAAEIASARTRVQRLLAEGQTDQAAKAYLELLNKQGDAALARDAQAMLGHHLYSCARWQDAAITYEVFLKRYPSDREATGIRLLLALICTRHLNDPVRAKALLANLRGSGISDEHAALARTLEAELG